jgi:hypothetical protein
MPNALADRSRSTSSRMLGAAVDGQEQLAHGDESDPVFADVADLDRIRLGEPAVG